MYCSCWLLVVNIVANNFGDLILTLLSLNTVRDGLGSVPNDVTGFDESPWEASHSEKWMGVGWGDGAGHRRTGERGNWVWYAKQDFFFFF